jgi:rhodanese-related sulfurtransferase
MKAVLVAIFLFSNLMLATALRYVKLRNSLLTSSQRSIQQSSMLGSVSSMSVVEFGNILKDADVRSTYQIVDVREPHELEIASIKGDDIINLPLSKAEEWSRDVTKVLDNSAPVICLCKVGMRSLRVATFLGLTFIFIYLC